MFVRRGPEVPEEKVALTVALVSVIVFYTQREKHLTFMVTPAD